MNPTKDEINDALQRLAVKFCDSDAMARDLTNDGALEYRLFLSRFLVFVGEWEAMQLNQKKEESLCRSLERSR